MEHARLVTLPRDAGFYTQERCFDVVVSSTACRTYTAPDGKTFQLQLDPVLQGLLQRARGKPHRAPLTDITVSALRFYRTGGFKMFEHHEYQDALFMLRYDFGQVFAATRGGSIGRVPSPQAKIHSEASARIVEMFGYGLALHFVAQMLGVPVERFFFVLASGARPDFVGRVTRKELLAAGATTNVLTPTGTIARVEVKAKTGWKSFREGGSGDDLMLNLARKAFSTPTGSMLAILVGIHPSSGRTRGKTRIVVADPGNGSAISEREQLSIVLREVLFMAYRLGLWITVRNLLQWLVELHFHLTDDEAHTLVALDDKYADIASQPNLAVRQYEGREFNGRVFSDVLMRLGGPQDRGMSESEARNILRLRTFGTLWYRGIDRQVERMIEQRDVAGLLRYGVRDAGEMDLSGKSMFFSQPEPMTDADQAEVAGVIESALNHW